MHVFMEVLSALGGIVTAATAVWTSRKIVPFLAYLRSQSDLLREITKLEYERDRAMERAEIERASAEAWQQRFDSIQGQIGEMRAEFNEKMSRMERKQDLSVRYICELIVWGHDKHTGPMPEPPEELQTEVQEALLERQASMNGK